MSTCFELFNQRIHSSILASLACSPNAPAELKGNGTFYSPLINWAQGPINEASSINTMPYIPPGDIDYNPYGTYPNNARCAWRLTAETGHVCRKLLCVYVRMYVCIFVRICIYI